MKLHFIIILLLCPFTGRSQVNVDSLWSAYNSDTASNNLRYNALLTLVDQHYARRNLDSAIAVLELYFTDAVRTNSKRNQHSATYRIGQIYARQGKFDEAINKMEETIELALDFNFEDGREGDFETLSSSYKMLGHLYNDKGQPRKAIELFQTASTYCDRDSLTHLKARLAIDQSDVLSYIGKMDSAKLILTEMQSFCEDAGLYTELAAVHMSMGALYGNQTLLDLEIKEYEKVIELSPKTERDIVAGSAYNGLGIVYRRMAKYEKSLESYRRSLVYKNKMGNKRNIANTISNMGSVFLFKGDYDSSLLYYTRGLEIRNQISDYRGQSASHLNIGVVYGEIGVHQKAKEHFARSLEIKRQFNDRFGMINLLVSMAASNLNLKDFQGVINCTDEALALIGDDNLPDQLANIYTNLAHMNGARGDSCYGAGDKDGAEIYYKLGLENLNKQLKILAELNLPVETISARQAISKMLRYLNEDGYLEQAQLAKKMAEQVNSQKSLLSASVTAYQANNSKGDSTKAQAELEKVVELSREDLINKFAILSEREKEISFEKMKYQFDIVQKFAFRNQNRSPEFVGNAYDNSLITKGLLLRSSTAIKSNILNSKDEFLIKKYEKWIDIQNEISKAFSMGGNVDSLEKIGQQVEKELVLGSAEFADLSKIINLSWKEVKAGLSEGETAVEIVRFSNADDSRLHKESDVLYCALVIKPNYQYPKMIRLFAEPELVEIIGTFPGNNISYIDQIYGSKKNTKTRLYELIWKPLEGEIGDSKKVYVSPVGLLHKISFSALAKDKETFLCDKHEIEIQTSTAKVADLLDSKTEAYNLTSLFGGIDYNSDSTSTEIWNYLDGSLDETSAIEKILIKEKKNYQHFTRGNASEEQFKLIAEKSGILHVATHGFFYANPEQTLEELLDAEESESNLVFRGGRTGLGMNTFVTSRNPLMRSGLAFAGANDVWNRNSIEGEDGVLTAAEVATIDMRSTELVVLSACETGLGDIKGSEGVYGLQRSFKMAGVKYIIMSLWQVPDKETAEFMTGFYEHLMICNDIRKSFNLTQQEMRKKYDSYYWAAFVLVE